MDFMPCDDNCPALTKKPYGTVKYCPMLENERHKNHDLPDDVSPFYGDYPPGEHPYCDHKDYTDCCLNFQCCRDVIDNMTTDELSIFGSMLSPEGWKPKDS